ncbi:putative extracellular cellulase CelA/allergen Asp F7-like [Aspergillus clavatus NRRL 1]|uniref:Cellulase, putative n=1 Tax=Aspergillus clavatus (strain ATCC 1007 / CBS 513.65 / DSM 816 / NCTC 3887 / NRRL 1 / QM 1276 / 107) TaxID=344612 RepID=A1CAQ3_ASPCL|nr:cellulase, putative [Aspergillus clavatus NRRL 1]EAW12821.1 cellulase, putative [Aspergillus clavatus NRRL 1]
MRYQRLTTLGVAALGAAASVSASPLFQRAENQCPPGYTMSVYYVTVTASPTPSIEPVTTLSSSSTTTVTTTVTPEAPAKTSSSLDVESSVPERTPVETPVASEPPVVPSSSSTKQIVVPTAEPVPVPVPEPIEPAPSSTKTTVATEPHTTAAPPVVPSSSSTKQIVIPTAEPVPVPVREPIEPAPSSTRTTVATEPHTTAAPPVAVPPATAPLAATTTAAPPPPASRPAGSNSGKATFYGGNVSGGTCSFSGYKLPAGLFGTALSKARWSDAAECGACVSVTGPNGNSIKAMIVDQCPECESNHLDLFQDAFAELADISKGIIGIDWSYVPCEIDSPLVLKNKEGTSRYWFSMQVVNANEPVASLEVSTNGGSTWQPTTRTYYNFFENASGFGADTVDVRVTGVSGKSLTVKNVGVGSSSSVTASSNL